MKIGIDISQIAFSGTGVASYTTELVRNLLRVDSENTYILFGISFRRGKTLKIFTDEVSKGRKNVCVKLFPIPLSLANKIWNGYHRIHVENLTGNLDVFHSSDWIQPPSRAKKITTVHDLIIYKFPELSHPYIVETQKKRLEWVKKDCDAIITDSFASRNDLVEILKFETEKIEVVYPGINRQYYKPESEDRTDFKRKYAITTKYILAVGTIEPRKNLKTVIEAFEKYNKHALISTNKEERVLLIAGNSGWEKNLQKAKNIRFLGYVPDQDMRDLYAQASMLLYPSFYEGFGLPVIEAMACGCPVITSDRGSLSEVAGDAALLVDPLSPDDLSHKMVQLTIDTQLRDEIIKKGLRNADKFTWEIAARKTVDVYKKIHES